MQSFIYVIDSHARKVSSEAANSLRVSFVSLYTEISNEMARIGAIKQSLEKALHDENKLWAKYLGEVEKKTGVDRLYVFLSMNVFLRIYFVNFFETLLSCLINQLPLYVTRTWCKFLFANVVKCF